MSTNVMRHRRLSDADIARIARRAVELDFLAQDVRTDPVWNPKTRRFEVHDALPELLRNTALYATGCYDCTILAVTPPGVEKAKVIKDGWYYLCILAAWQDLLIPETPDCSRIPDAQMHHMFVQKTYLDAIERAWGVRVQHAYSLEDQSSWYDGCNVMRIYELAFGPFQEPSIWLTHDEVEFLILTHGALQHHFGIAADEDGEGANSERLLEVARRVELQLV